MAKRSGSKGSRSERNAGRQRAQRAREHGLPARVEPARRTHVATLEPSRDDERESSSDTALATKPLIPPVIKLAGVAALLLGAAYALTHWRDRDESDVTSEQPEPAVAAPIAPAAAPDPTPPPIAASSSPSSETPATAPAAPSSPVVKPHVIMPNAPSLRSASVPTSVPLRAPSSATRVSPPSPPAPPVAPALPAADGSSQ